jgi:hypothetical protein
VEFQNDLTAEEYAALMNDNIKDLMELMLRSLERIKENKAKVARAYNKKVKLKEFQVRFGMGSSVTIGNQGRGL